MLNTYNHLQSRCKLAGTDIKTVCERAGIPASRIYKWNQHEPDSLKTLRKLESAIDAISEENYRRAGADV